MKGYMFLVSTKERDGDREWWETRPAIRAGSPFEVAAKLHRELKDIRVEAKSEVNRREKINEG